MLTCRRRPEVNVDESEEGRQAWFRSMWEGEQQETKDEEEEAANGEDDFGDDFDDFAEGGEDDADFGDFDEAEVPVQSIPEKQQQQMATPPAPDILAGLVSSNPIHTPSLPLTSLPAPTRFQYARATSTNNATISRCHNTKETHPG